MSYSNSISPVGWYVASYLIRFVELDAKGNDDLEGRFLSWENTVIIKATEYAEAYAKVLAVAEKETVPYQGGPDGIPVQWVFEGITELLPIYDELEDGAEIMWRNNNTRKLKTLKNSVKSYDELLQNIITT